MSDGTPVTRRMAVYGLAPPQKERPVPGELRGTPRRGTKTGWYCIRSAIDTIHTSACQYRPYPRLTFAATSGTQRRLAHQALGHSQTTELSKLVLIPCLRHGHWSLLPSDQAAGKIHHSPVLGILTEYNTPVHHHPLS